MKFGFYIKSINKKITVQYGIDEISYGVFAKDGNYALGAIGKYAVNVSPVFLEYWDEWTLDQDGEKEDCIEEMKKLIAVRESIYLPGYACSNETTGWQTEQ